MTRAARVLAALEIAARISDRADPLGREAREGLEALGVLSKEGVELALSTHVERAEDTDLAAVLASVGEARRAWVVASANVCVAPIRAIALGLAAADEVIVKPSRRDPVIARLLVRELDLRGLSVREATALEAEPGDVVHAYGSDETIATIARSLAPGVAFVGHGTGLGLAVVAADDDVHAATAALAADVVAFDQAGCLSPRVCVVEGDAARGDAVAAALSDALSRSGREVPRGPSTEGDRLALLEYERTMLAIGAIHRGEHHLVGVDAAAPRILVGPPLRVVTVVAYPTAADALGALAPLSRLLTAIGAGAGAFAAALRRAIPGARPSALGAMQRPPFDGPVDRRGH
ncbi:MAG: acyl-CoA reductase [Polyangiaceae bacterium]